MPNLVFRYCTHCRTPYPERALPACPSCETVVLLAAYARERVCDDD